MLEKRQTPIGDGLYLEEVYAHDAPLDAGKSIWKETSPTAWCPDVPNDKIPVVNNLGCPIIICQQGE